jgi:hypothetical protein
MTPARSRETACESLTPPLPGRSGPGPLRRPLARQGQPGPHGHAARRPRPGPPRGGCGSGGPLLQGGPRRQPSRIGEPLGNGEGGQQGGGLGRGPVAVEPERRDHLPARGIGDRRRGASRADRRITFGGTPSSNTWRTSKRSIGGIASPSTGEPAVSRRLADAGGQTIRGLHGTCRWAWFLDPI